MRVAAHAHRLRIVAFSGEMAGISIQQTIQDMKNVFESKGIEFGTANPPMLLFVPFLNSIEQ